MKIFRSQLPPPSQAGPAGVGVQAVGELRALAGQTSLKPGLGAVAAVAALLCLGSRAWACTDGTRATPYAVEGVERHLWPVPSPTRSPPPRERGMVLPVRRGTTAVCPGGINFFWWSGYVRQIPVSGQTGMVKASPSPTATKVFGQVSLRPNSTKVFGHVSRRPNCNEGVWGKSPGDQTATLVYASGPRCSSPGPRPTTTPVSPACLRAE